MVYNIAIVGAGPAGCMLARLLLHLNNHNLNVSIFESEAALDFRSQGGTLDLHVKTGQAALKAAGLFDEFSKYARYDGEAMKFADKDLLCYVQTGGGKPGSLTGRPEIDRPQLREMLYNSLPEGTVRWRKKLTRVDADNRSLYFADGTIEQSFDLIVGADGAWSRVRSVLTDVKPFYSGIGGHALRILDAQQKHPELYDLVNRGSLFSWSDGKSIMAQYMSDGSLNVSTWSVRAEGWQMSCGYDIHDAKAVKDACLEDFAGWDEMLLAFTQAAEDDVTPRDLYMLPVGTKWDHVPGVTVIGDAAHLMTPFAGEGVNLAFEDCLKLSEAIFTAASSNRSHSTQEGTTEGTSQLDTNIHAFEQDMFSRARKTGQMTYDMLELMYLTPGAPRTCVERYLLRAVEDELGRTLTVLLTPVVYLWFFVFKLLW
ncbi:hypothetical protein LTR85_010787 [Meristemomyces frigidus]|nr:hypothetical protein LTR85_010787 [Meristemomyces frigidus]